MIPLLHVLTTLTRLHPGTYLQRYQVTPHVHIYSVTKVTPHAHIYSVTKFTPRHIFTALPRLHPGTYLQRYQGYTPCTYLQRYQGYTPVTYLQRYQGYAKAHIHSVTKVTPRHIFSALPRLHPGTY